ncbi:MAG: cbb3-type cytochrome c oxidase subunit I, partial [Anaerolineales bacterium]|nr:cbb3-type cytochrome c oxidase subunit I [Anaerolineales bacterium]
AADLHLQDTFWVVGHFHYTIVTAQIFGVMAAIYYWFPKITGRMYNETLGKIHFWLMFITFNTTFFPMFYLGLNGMNRRVATYIPELGGVNLWVSVSGFLLGASFLLFVYIVLQGWLRGEPAGDNPWEARTLEWQTSSPPPHENFEGVPRVTGGPYDYGVPDSVHAVVPVGAGGQD